MEDEITNNQNDLDLNEILTSPASIQFVKCQAPKDVSLKYIFKYIYFKSTALSNITKDFWYNISSL